ncbi:MAG: hypothetical protein AAB521_03625 [Patescibacteria group bacterium]
MNEREFIKELQERAKEQEAIIKDMPFPKVFSTASVWLGIHPWRFVIPFAFLISIILRFFIGPSYTDFILSIFKIPLLKIVL